MAQDNIDKLYDALEADGAVKKSKAEFRNWFLADGDEGVSNRMKLHRALQEDGAFDGSYDEFATKFGIDPEYGEGLYGTNRRVSTVDDAPTDISNDLIQSSNRAAQDHDEEEYSQDAPSRGTSKSKAFGGGASNGGSGAESSWSGGASVVAKPKAANPVGQVRRQQQKKAAAAPKPKKKGWQPTWQQRAAINSMFDSSRKNFNARTRRGSEALRNMAKDPLGTNRFKLDPTRKRKGESVMIRSSRVKKTEPKYNPETNKYESTYVDQNGMEYNNLADAQAVQLQYDRERWAEEDLENAIVNLYDEESRRASDESDDMMEGFGNDPEDSFQKALVGAATYRNADPIGSTMSRLLRESPEARDYVMKMTDYYVNNGVDPVEAQGRARAALRSRIQERAKSKMRPTNTTAYVLMNAFGNSLFGLASRAAISSMSNSEIDNLQEAALNEYGEQEAGAVGRVAASIAPLVVDIIGGGFAGPSAAGSAVSKGVTNLVGRAGASALGIGAKEGARRVGTRFGTQLLAGMAGGAVNFGVYNAQSSTLRGIAQGNLSAGDVGNEFLHGLRNGFIFGGVGATMGKLTEGLTGGAALLGEAGTIVAEGSTFAALDALDVAMDKTGEKKFTAENLATSFGMALGGRVGHPVKYISNLAARVKGEMGPIKNFRLSKDTYNEIAGKYPELANLLENRSVVDDLVLRVKNGKGDKGANGALDRMSVEFEQMKNDKSVPWEVVRMAEWVLNGKVMPEPMILDYNSYQRADGTWVGKTYDQNGREIARYDLGKEKSKDRWEKKVGDSTWRNTIEVAEGVANMRSMSESYMDVLRDIQKDANWEGRQLTEEELLTIFQNALKNKRAGAKLSEVEEYVLNKVMEEGPKNFAAHDIVNRVKAEVQEKWGVDVDKAIKKGPNKITDTEREALVYYYQEIGGKAPENEGAETGAREGVDERYWLGYNSRGMERRNIEDELDGAIDNLGEVGLQAEALDALIADGRIYVMLQNEQWSPEQKQAALDYMNAKAAQEGMLSRVRDDIDKQVAQTSIEVQKRVAAEDIGDGMIHPAVLRDGREVDILSGKVVVNDDGSVDTGASEKGIIVRDPSTGKVEMVNPGEIKSVGEVIDPNTIVEAVAKQISEEITNDAAAIIEGTRYKVKDGQDVEHDVDVVADNGDGTLSVRVDGADELSLISKEEFAKMIGVQPEPKNDIDAKNDAEDVEGTDNGPNAENDMVQADENAGSDLEMPMKEVGKGKDKTLVPDFDNATAEQSYNYLFGEGTKYPVAVADKIVANTIKELTEQLEKATAALEKANNVEPSLGDNASIKDIVAIEVEVAKAAKAKEKAQADLEKAQLDLAKWEQVQKMRGESVVATQETRIIDPRNMTDEERQRRGEMLKSAPAITVAPNQIVSTEDKSARKVAEEWWDKNVGEPQWYDTEIGQVEINRNSVESSLAHRYGQMKLDAITSLVDGFNNAVYLGTMPDGTRQEGIMNHYFAYPINYNGKRCYVFCRALHDNNTNRLYVHEVFVGENIKKGNTLQTAASQPHGGIALYRDILANVLDSSEDPTRPALEPGTSTDSSGVNSGQTEGATTPTGNSPRTSEGKVSAKDSDLQAKVEKNAENERKSNIQGLESYSEDELRVIVEEHVRSAIADADMDAEITGIRFIGSRTTGTARADSDLDVLVEYQGTAREDSLFNVLNDEDNRLVIDGITVDINPITPGKSGTIEEFLKRNAGYKKETAVQEQIALAEQQTDTSPSEAQKEAGNYKKGHVKIDGFDISIEQPKGSVRSGVDATGKAWSQKMNNTYGYIRGTEGVDGDHIDVFLSDSLDGWNGTVYVVDQVEKGGIFDEHKVMYGFNSEEEARKAYLSNYEKGWQGLGAITPVSKEEFKKWVDSSHRKTKPFAEYKNVKVGETQEQEAKQQGTLFPATEQQPSSKSETKPRTTEKQPAEAPKERIDDVGEKIEGAKKDLAKKMGERINLDADTFPKMFPKYDLKKLISQGLDPNLAVMTKMLRQMAQADYKHYSKKRMYGKSYALRAARFYAAYAKQVLEAGDSNVDFKSEGLGFTDYGKQFVELNKRLFEELYNKLGDDLFDLDLAGVKIQPLSQKEGSTWFRRNQETGEMEPYNPAYAFVGPRGQNYYEANELDKALQEGVEQVTKSIDYKKAHPYKLGHYYKPGIKNSDYVGVKLGGKIVPLTEPMTSSEVRKYMSEHNAELQAKAAQLDEQRKLDKKKGGTGEGRWKPELTLGGGRPRVGVDRRGGVDVEPEEFRKAFSFRGVQFGNYVTQRERQRFLNEAYDALMDMAELLGISPRAIAIDGRLGFAIGARGGGKANAHYEPKENVINLTKSKGAGSLAHEWFHALDYYFNRGNKKPTASTANKSTEQFPASTRNEMRKAFLDLMSAIKNSDYFKRSENLEMKLRSGKLDEGYYDKPTELAARAFQDYVVRKLADKGKINDFLSSFTSEEEWNGEPENYPFPIGAEAEKIDEKFDALFDAMQERTDEEGNTILYHLGKDHDVLTDTEIALRDGLVDVMRSVGIDVETDEVKGQKVLDNAIQANATLQEMRGWHGSAAEFDEFDHSHMSEGEGNQAIGYGTYIASIEEIGRYYGTVAAMQKRFRAAPGYGDYDHYWKGQKIDLSSINPLRMAYDIVQREGTIKKAITMVEKFVDNPEAHEGWRSALDILRESRKSDFKRKRANYEGERYLYEVDIPENDGTNYLPWDEPLSDAMRERIAQGLRDMGVDLNEPFERRSGKADNFDFLDEQMSEHPITGQELYYKLVDRFGRYPQQASEFLNKYCGLVGIEYPSNFFSGGNKKGLKNHVIFNEKDIKIDNRTQYFISADGVVYGFVKDGKIYIDPKIATVGTPIHEYCHLWGDALKEANPEAWERLKETMLGEKDVLDYVKKMYPGLEGDALVSEVFSHYSGRRGAERLRADMERETKNAEDVFAKARVARVFDIIRRALSRFWEMARDLFAGKTRGLDKLTAEDFADMAMNDLLRGFNPRKKVSGETFYSNAERAVENIKQNKATAEQWKAMIKKTGGIKSGEDKWMGLNTWLDENKGKSLTKDEVLQFVRDNGIQMEEVNYGDIYETPGYVKLNDEYMALFGDVEKIFQEANKQFADYVGEMEAKYGERYYSQMTPQERQIYNRLSIDQELRDPNIYSDEDIAFREMVDRYGDDFDMAFRATSAGLEIDDRGAASYFVGNAQAIDLTRLDYTTEGLENNREIAFVVPNIEPYQEHDEIHFGPENQGKAVMWVRFGETYDANGKRVLVIDEIQSNRHQDARKEGYRDAKPYQSYLKFKKELDEKYGDGQWTKFPDIAEKFGLKLLPKEELVKFDKLFNDWRESERALENFRRIPDAPFDKNWHEVAMKRMLRLAAEEGFDKVAWTTGAQQAERYNIGGVVDEVSVAEWNEPLANGKPKTEATVRIHYKNGDSTKLIVDKNTGIVKAFNDMNNAIGKPLSDILGKELAQKILDNKRNYETWSGEDLRIGGEGMKGFYDNILPRFMDKYGKRWGVKTGTVELPNVEEAGRTMHSVDVTPEMKESVMQGQPLFHRGDNPKEVSAAERELLNGLVDVMRNAGIDVVADDAEGLRVLDEVKRANDLIAEMKRNQVQKPRKLDSSDEEKAHITDVSEPDGAKVLQNIENLAKKYEEKSNQPRTFLDDLAIAIGARKGINKNPQKNPQPNHKSKYADFITLSGLEVTVRLANHNASAKYFDDNGELEGISIVVSGTPNKGIKDNGNAHIIEHFYSEKDLRKADGKPLVEIIRSLGQALRSGEYKDTTGLATPQEVNGTMLQGMKLFKTENGEVYGFVKDGKIYLDPSVATSETGIHEYAHLWGDWLREANPEAWEQLKNELLKKEDVLAVVRRLYPDLEGDELMGEVFANFGGKRGAERLRNERDRLMSEEKDPAKKNLIARVFDRIKSALERFWNMARDMMAGKVEGVEKLSAEDFADMMMNDLLRGVKPEAKREERVRYSIEEDVEDSGISDEELSRYNAGGLSYSETAARSLMELSERNRNDYRLRLQAMREFGRNLQSLRSIMSKQRTYDKKTVDNIIRLSRAVMDTGFFKGMSAYEVKRLLSAINKGVGMRDLTKIANGVVDMLTTNQLRESKDMLSKLMKVKGSKVDSRGVEVQAGLDIEGQRTMSALKEGMEMDRQNLESRFNDCLDRMGSDDEVVRKNAESEYEGLMLARQYHDMIKDSEQEEIGLRQEKRDAEERIYDFSRVPVLDENGAPIMNIDGTLRTTERKVLKPEFKTNVTEENKNLRRDVEAKIASLESSIRDNRAERVDGYRSLMNYISGDIKAARERAKAWIDAQMQHVNEIHHNANSDLEDIDATSQNREKSYVPLFNPKNDLMRGIMMPMATFENMMRYFGRKFNKGEGYLFNRYVRGMIDCMDNEWRSLHGAHETLDAKVSEIMGKKMKWSDLFTLERKKRYPGIEVEYWDNGIRKKDTLSQGEALSLYVWSRQKDAEAGLRGMGIQEEDIEALKSKIAPKFIEIADWVVKEFLPERRKYYNEVHERTFGAPMAAIENYFPIVRQKRDLPDTSDITERNQVNTNASTITGSWIKRVRTGATLDVHTDFFDHVLKHLEDMEHTAAWAEFNRDLNTLRHYKRFRNRVENMSSLEYGAGKDLWTTFDNTCAMVAGEYGGSDPQTHSKLDKIVLNINKGFTAGAIAFRINTALKQLLSLPAFWSDASAEQLAKYQGPWGWYTSWKWAMENLPGFSKRWQSRQVGDTRLMDTDMDWKLWRNQYLKYLSRGGMWANALVDAITVASGSKAVYETKKRRYLSDGYSEEQAEKRALQDAAISYNSSQQSSEGGFVSEMQVNRTFLNNMLTIYKNSSFSYGRRFTTGMRELKKRMKPGYKSTMTEAEALRMERDGVDKNKAEKAARRLYRWNGLHSLFDIFNFGYLLPFFWTIIGGAMWYLSFGNDDEKKKEILGEGLKRRIWLTPMEGFTGGNILSDYGTKIINYTFDDEAGQKALRNILNSSWFTTPMEGETNKFTNDIAFDKSKAWWDVFSLAVQTNLGFKPETFTDILASIADYCDGDPKTTKEFLLCFMRVMQVPQSQIDQIYVDELGMSAKDAQQLPADQLAKRFATYKMRKNNPLTYISHTEGDDKVFEKYKGKFEDMMQERVEKMSDEGLQSNFGANDDLRRKLVGKTYAKRRGVEDTAGKKPNKDWKEETQKSHLIYQDKRNFFDIAEDTMLEVAEKNAKEDGNKERLKEIRDAQAELTAIKRGVHNNDKNIYGLGEGSAADDEAIMRTLRERRKALIKELKL